MTNARRDIVNPDEVGEYHCISRCVRRAYLCGKDNYSGRSYEHRREWIRTRLAELAGIFAVEVVAYAILSNHLHTLLRIRPDIAATWSAEEVALRWKRLFPGKHHGRSATEPSEREIKAIASSPEKVAQYRERLSSISWFNRCLNENIARRSNAEDDCTGRFWEGRFKCQRVSGSPAVLMCAAYIDLNPIRAGIAETPEQSDHTSVQDRIHELTGQMPERCRDWSRVPLLSIAKAAGIEMTESEYIMLVDETGRQFRDGKHRISEALSPILERLNVSETSWLETTQHLTRKFRRVVAKPAFIRKMAARCGRTSFHGLTHARKVFERPSSDRS